MSTSHVGILLRHLHRLLGGPRDAVPDDQLLGRFIRQKDEPAFTALMRRHGPLVWGVSRRVAGHEQDAEDVFQATFLVLARKAATIRKGASVGSWLYGVAHGLALRKRTDTARQRGHERRVIALPAPDPSAELTWRELRTVLDEELARLPEKYRAPLLLCYFEGLTHEEAARQLGWKKRAVKDRLERGRNRFRVRLTRRGLALSTALTGSMLAPEASSAAVPVVLADATVRATRLYATSQPLLGAVSPRVIALVEGGLKAMFLSKLQTAMAGLLALAVVIGGAGLLLSYSSRPASPPDAAPLEEPEKGHVDRLGDPLPPGAVMRLGTIRYRFGYRLAGFLPDGKTVVSAQDHAVQFWEARTGRPVREIDTGNLSISNLALSRDGKRIALGGALVDNAKPGYRSVIRVLDVSSGKEARTFDRDVLDGVHALTFTPDGKLLMSLGRNGALRIEEVDTGLELLRHQFPGDVLAYIALSPDGSTLAMNSGPNTRKLFVWKWQTGEEPSELKVAEHTGREIVFSADGNFLAECGDHEPTVRVWDIKRARLLHQLELPDPGSFRHHSVAFLPDGRTLAAAASSNEGGAIHLWDPATGGLLKRLNLGGGALAFSPDRKLLVAGSRVWDFGAARELSANDEAHQDGPTRIAVTPGGLVVSASDDHTIRVWEPATGKQRLKLEHGYWVRGIAVSPDGTKLVSSSLDDTVCLWDLATGRKIYRLPGHGRSGGHRAVAFTGDSRHFLSWGDDMYLRKWNVETGKAVLEHALRPSGVKVPDRDAEPQEERERSHILLDGAFSPDGKTFVMNAGLKFHVFDVETGKETRTIPREGSYVISLTVSPDGRLLLASAWGNPVEIKLPGGAVQHTTGKSHPVTLWDLASGKIRKQMMLPEEGAGPVAFSTDGKLFAVASERPGTRIRLYEVATGQEVQVIAGFQRTVRSLAFLPDGMRLVSGMDDTTALVWKLSAER
jgi:RNA polymerase sigma factor (sigma-70 family)